MQDLAIRIEGHSLTTITANSYSTSILKDLCEINYSLRLEVQKTKDAVSISELVEVSQRLIDQVQEATVKVLHNTTSLWAQISKLWKCSG